MASIEVVGFFKPSCERRCPRRDRVTLFCCTAIEFTYSCVLPFSVIRSILAAQSDEPDDSDKPDEISGDTAPVIDKNDVTELRKTLCSLSLEERKALPGLPVERADVMPAALVAIDTVLKCAGRDAVIQSSYNLRYGIAAELLG